MNDEELKKSVVTLELYRAQLESLMKQEEILHSSLEDHLRAKETILNLKNIEDEEILLPIGADVFLYAKLLSKDEVLFGLGSDTLIRTSVEDAAQKFDTHITSLRDAGEKIANRIRELETQISALSAKIQQEIEIRRE